MKLEIQSQVRSAVSPSSRWEEEKKATLVLRRWLGVAGRGRFRDADGGVGGWAVPRRHLRVGVEY